MAKVKIGFRNLNIAQKRQFVAKVKQLMLNNPSFPGAAAYLSALSAADAKLGADATTAEASRAQSKIDTTLQNASEKALDSAMATFGNAIELESGGDEAKILSSGLEVQADPTASTTPLAPGNLTLSRGDDPGEAHGQFDPVSGATGYLARYCVGDAPIGPWTMLEDSFTKSNFDIPGLQSGSHVWVETRATNPAGPSPWSNPSDIYVP